MMTNESRRMHFLYHKALNGIGMASRKGGANGSIAWQHLVPFASCGVVGFEMSVFVSLSLAIDCFFSGSIVFHGLWLWHS